MTTQQQYKFWRVSFQKGTFVVVEGKPGMACRLYRDEDKDLAEKLALSLNGGSK